MTNTTWREGFKPIIAKVLAETKGLPKKEVDKALKEQFLRLGDIRGAHPYRIYRDEIARQQGKKKPVKYKIPLSSQLPQLF